LIGGIKRIRKDNSIFINMLPKKFYLQNIEKRKKILSNMRLFTITYDYQLNPYYAEYIKESYERWGNIVDYIGVLQLTGYDEEEVIFNFHQIMNNNYINTKKLTEVEITDIEVGSVINKSIF